MSFNSNRKEPNTMLYTHGHTTPGCGAFGAVRTRDGVPWSINGTGAEEPTDWRYPLTSSAASVPCRECQRILRDVASRTVVRSALATTTEATELRSELERVQQELNNARREIEMLQGITESKIDNACDGVRMEFMRFALPPLRSILVFAMKLRAGTPPQNPEVLAVPVANLIRMLHRQGFATEAELPLL